MSVIALYLFSLFFIGCFEDEKLIGQGLETGQRCLCGQEGIPPSPDLWS